MSYADVRHHYEDPPTPEEQEEASIERAVDAMDEDELRFCLRSAWMKEAFATRRVIETARSLATEGSDLAKALARLDAYAASSAKSHAEFVADREADREAEEEAALEYARSRTDESFS